MEVHIADRTILQSSLCTLQYLPQAREFAGCKSIDIIEDCEMVDGLGGTTWDGAFVMASVLEALNLSHSHVLELGGGDGLCSIIAAMVSKAQVTSTDRFVDLTLANVERCRVSASEPFPDIHIAPLEWGCLYPDNSDRSCEFKCSEDSLLASRGPVDLIIGVEIAVLRLQQDKLTATINRLSGPNTVVLMGFDEGPPPNTCGYEKDFIERMTRLGFCHGVICTARIRSDKPIVIETKSERKG